MKKIEMIGQQYGNLLVLEEHSKYKNGIIKYLCKCKCGNNTIASGDHIRRGNIKSCGCATPIGKLHKDWNGVGKISGAFWYDHIVRSANGSKGRKPLLLNVDKKYVWELFEKQSGKCALSGMDITFPKKHNDKSWTASLDRIDSSKGYEKGNVQWVHKDINMMKRNYSQDYFIKMCKLIFKWKYGNEPIILVGDQTFV